MVQRIISFWKLSSWLVKPMVASMGWVCWSGMRYSGGFWTSRVQVLAPQSPGSSALA
ncbi:hypothetical protein [Nocardia sp. CDC160]|uniref:hypothetical protein n=1 Tax=Nocardia sp. CDC160 TaxID=3112166 RepID=UPI002DB839BA|nr:hypothetical protein [Nocardia sp. CDC160]MEC3919434.1 hypothetical protein [Nocardia sp. CDC160]